MLDKETTSTRLFKITSLDVITGTKLDLDTGLLGVLDLYTKREAREVLDRLNDTGITWYYIYDMEYVPPVKGE